MQSWQPELKKVKFYSRKVEVYFRGVVRASYFLPSPTHFSFILNILSLFKHIPQDAISFAEATVSSYNQWIRCSRETGTLKPRSILHLRLLKDLCHALIHGAQKTFQTEGHSLLSINTYATKYTRTACNYPTTSCWRPLPWEVKFINRIDFPPARWKPSPAPRLQSCTTNLKQKRENTTTPSTITALLLWGLFCWLALFFLWLGGWWWFAFWVFFAGVCFCLVGGGGLGFFCLLFLLVFFYYFGEFQLQYNPIDSYTGKSKELLCYTGFVVVWFVFSFKHVFQ